MPINTPQDDCVLAQHKLDCDRQSYLAYRVATVIGEPMDDVKEHF